METRQRRSFTDDYKRQAVDLLDASGTPPLCRQLQTFDSFVGRTYPTRNSRMGAMHQLPVVPICRMGSRLRRRANQKHLLAYPVSMKRDVRAVVTIREAGM